MASLGSMVRRHPVASYYLLLMSVLMALVLWPTPLYWIYGEPFDFVELMGSTVQASGVELRTSALLPLLQAVSAEPVLVFLVLFGGVTSLFAVLVTAVGYGRPGVVRLLQRLRPWAPEIGAAAGVRCWLLGIAFVSLAYLTLFLVRCLISEESREATVFNPDLLGAGAVWLFLEALFLNQGALLEELGIRGYLQAQLNRIASSPLRAALAVGCLWALFHFPRDLLFGSISAMGLVGYLVFMLFFSIWCIGGSVIIAYFFNRSGGSVLIAIALHGLLNDSWGLGGRFMGNPIIELSSRALVIAFFALILVALAGRNLGITPQARADDLPGGRS